MRGTRAKLPLALLPILVLAACVAMTPVASAEGGTASVAKKKKCKKGFKLKKGKCKKKKAAPVPVPLPPPGPVVRMSLSWTQDSDVDLHAYDAAGNHSGWDPTGIRQGIPDSLHGGDSVGAGGSESFTDNVFVRGGLANREFAYVVCFYGAATSVSYTAVNTAGISQSGTIAGVAGDAFTLTIPSGPPAPSVNPC